MFHEVFVAVDQVVNAVLGGYSDESISARSFRLGSKAKARGAWDQWRITWVIADWLFLWRTLAGLWTDCGQHLVGAYHSEVNGCNCRHPTENEYARKSTAGSHAREADELACLQLGNG
jgi:hypothetical protein